MNIAPLFTGARIRLSAFRPDDAAAFHRWYLDSDFSRHLDSSPAMPKSENRLARWLDEEERNRDTFMFAIRTLDVDAIIGFIQIDDVMWNNRTAWVAIGIGEAEFRGHGYGYEAMGLALQFAFHEINLHRLQLTVFSYNTRAVRLYEKLGFKREGVFREALLRDGKRFHMFIYGLLAHEWAEAD